MSEATVHAIPIPPKKRLPTIAVVAISVVSTIVLVGLAAILLNAANPTPVSVRFTPAILTDSLVMVVSNESTGVLQNVVVSVQNPKSGNSKSWTIPSLGVGVFYTSQTFGVFEGWRFEPGELITIQAAGYSPLRLKVP